PAADRLLLQPDLYELGGRDLRLGPRAAPWPGRRKRRLDLDVCADAARLRLLPGAGAAVLAATCLLVAAADLRVRGHAGAVDRPHLPRRPDGRGARDQRRPAGGCIFGIPCPLEERQAPRFAARRRRISSLSRGFAGLLASQNR